MLKEEIEKEVQARVEFKLNEIKTSIQNQLGWAEKNYWGAGLHNVRQFKKAETVFEANRLLNEIFKKEMLMSVPYDKMREQKNRVVRDKYVEKFINRYAERYRGIVNVPYESNHIADLIEQIIREVNYGTL